MVGGASFVQQNTNVFEGASSSGMPFDMMGMMGKSTTTSTGQHQKDFRKLEASLVKMCTFQCLRRERAFEAESEMCMAKCFDVGYIYMRIGIAELNSFSYENRIES